MRFVQSGLAIGVAGISILVGSAAQASVIGAGDLVVFQAGEGGATAVGNNASFSILELTRAAGQASPVQTFGISASATDPLWASASATSTGYLSLSQNRNSVQFAGHTTRGTGSPLPNINTITARGVGSVSAAGTYSLLGSYTGSGGNQARSGGLMTNGDLFISDQGGFYATGGTVAALVGNIRNVRSFGNTLYVMQQSTSAPVVSAVSGTPAAPAIAGLPGLTFVNTAQDFYLVSSLNDSNFDLLYLTTTAGISKFQLVAGTWTARGTAAVSGGLFGLAAEADAAGGVSLFVTTGGGASAANTVKLFVDSAGPGFNVTLDAGTTLFTAPANTTLKGIEIIPAPGASVLLVAGGMLAVRRRRR